MLLQHHLLVSCPAGARVLFDPWLVGDLQFFEQGWLYTGKKRGMGGSSGVQVDLQSIADDTDVILITQVTDSLGFGV